MRFFVPIGHVFKASHTLITLLFCCLLSAPLTAQFSFEYTGPDTLYVGDDCTAILDWGHPNTPTASPTVPGQVIIQFVISSISGGYSVGDPVTPGQAITIFYQAQDNMGHFAMFGFSIFIVDTIAPQFDPSTLPPDITVQCSIDDPAQGILYSDNCESDTTPVNLTFMEIGETEVCEGGTLERIWKLQDFWGNTTTYSQLITLEPDTVPPVINSTLEDGTGDCEDAINLYTTWIQTQRNNFSATDAGCGVMTLSDNGPEPSVLQDFCGDVPVDFFATDSCGNSVSVTATFTVTNSTAPTITIEAEDSMASCDSGNAMSIFNNWIDSRGGAAAEDDCSEVIWQTIPPNPSLADTCNGEILVQFIATDGCGNSASTTAAFLVQDNTPPTIIEEAGNRIFSCAVGDFETELGLWLSTAANSSATDICTPDDSLELTFKLNGVEIDSAGIALAIQDSIMTGCVDGVVISGLVFNNVLALIHLTFVYTDACGNSVETQGYFGITDSQGPTFTEESRDTIIGCVAGNNLEQVFAEWYESGGYALAEDDCGNVYFRGEPGYEEAWSDLMGALDSACTAGASVTIDFYANDFCDNETAYPSTATFTVLDSVAPAVVRQAGNLNLDCEPQIQDRLNSWLDTLGGAVAEDNCADVAWMFFWENTDGDTLAGVPGEGPYPDLFEFGCELDLQVLFQVTDLCGNSAATQGSFSSLDTVPPEFEANIPDITISCEELGDTATFLVTDNCGDAQVMLTFEDDTLSNPDPMGCGQFTFELSRTWIASDACGNSSTTEQMITVSDEEAPSFEGPADITIACANIDNTDLTGSPQNIMDNCDPNPGMSYTDEQMGTGCDFSVTRTWYVEDACGNIDSSTQMITVLDTLAPVLVEEPQNLVVPCDTTEDISVIFNAWVESGGFTNFLDECGSVEHFLAEPGSYSIGDPGTYPGTPVTLPDLESCESAIDGIFLEVLADLVYYDACGNAGFSTIRFSVEDNNPPVILLCPQSIELETGDEDCSAILEVFPPLAREGCFAEHESINLASTKDITSSSPGDTNTIINNLDFSFNISHPGPDVIVAPVELRIRLNGADANESDEFFSLYDENGQLIGTTEILDEECGDGVTTFVLTSGQLNAWASDGTVDFQLIPNDPEGMPGSAAINDICPDASVTIELDYRLQTPAGLRYAYRINGGDTVFLNGYELLSINLESGSHEVEFLVGDCSGNFTSCNTDVQVVDRQNPFIQCPNPIDTVLNDINCAIDMEVPLPRTISDNCGFADSYTRTLPATPEEGFLTFSFDDEINDYLADDFVVVFDDVQPVSTGTVKIIMDMRGDLEDFDEYFTLYLDGSSYGTTETGQTGIHVQDCNGLSRATITISRGIFNVLAEDGMLEVELRTYRDFNSPPDGPGDGINPCDPGLIEADGDVDSISFAQVTLSYPLTRPQVYTTGATETGITDFPPGDDPLVLEFQGGVTQLHYIIEDASGNRDTCETTVTVRDEVPPVAICQPGILYINPSGVVNGEISFEIIDGGSEDNCTIDNVIIEPSDFSCDSVGTTQDVMMIVIDEFGNRDTCFTEVRIEAEVLQPTYEVGICENDTLRIFANVPDAPGNPYTFSWTGPNGFVSSLENPVIPGASPAASGTYILEVIGLNGCGSTGTVEIVVDELNAPSLQSQSDTICIGDPVVLMATDYTQSVTYSWFRGMAPNGLPLNPPTTINPTTTDTPPAAGSFSYYVIVESDACISNPSQNVLITVLAQPEAEVAEPFIEVCEGEDIMLQAVSGGPNMTYQWTGPNGFNSTQQNPPAITSATEANEGFYELVVFIGDCASESRFVQVLVKQSPEQPVIAGDTAFCEQSTLVLTVNNLVDADQYIWTNPNNLPISTPGNTLFVENISGESEGDWTVQAILDGCPSPVSEPFFISIDSALLINIAGTSPICEGDSTVLQVPLVSDAEYLWEGPMGFSSSEANPKVPSTPGIYSLTVTSNAGCTTTASTEIEVVQPVTINAVSNTAGDCAKPGDSVSFEVTLFPPDDGSYTYEWTGPGGFTSADSLPVIYDLDETDNGVYTLVVYIGNCPSLGHTDTIAVTNAPAQPEIQGENTLCNGADLLLDVPGYSGNGVNYFWTTPVGNFEFENDSLLLIEDISEDVTGQFSVVVSINGCPSAESDAVNITVVPPLEAPVISANSVVCEGDTLFLATPALAGASYLWTGPNGFTSDQQNPSIFPIMSENAGSYQLQVSVQGCPSETSTPLEVMVNALPTTPVIEDFTGSVCLDQPGSIELCIDPASMDGGENYFWMNGATGELLGQSTTSPCIVIEDFSSFTEGNNSITVQSEIDGCRSAESTALLVPMFEFPDEVADAGTNGEICLNQMVLLSASVPGVSAGMWTPLNTSAQINNVNTPQTDVTGLQEGSNLFIWSLSYEACVNYSIDTVEIFVEPIPKAVTDTVIVPFGQTTNFNVTLNDSLTNTYTIALESNPVKGNTLHQGNGTFVYTPNIGYVGQDLMEYLLCSEICPDQCTIGKVVLRVGDDDDCFVPTLFTPNEDGVNDRLIIPCLETERYPANRIVVFNEWGDEVFSAAPYRNDWDGRRKGKDLPAGTYFLLVDFGDGSPAKRTFLILDR